MTERTDDAISDMDAVAHELADVVVEDYQRLKQQITRPALSKKLTRQELWQKFGPDYAQTREDPATWQMTLDAMGEKEATAFSREMELALQEFGGAEASAVP